MENIAFRILVVEDAKPMSDLLDQALSESGYRVAVAANGVDAMRLAEGQDLLLVDVMLPGLNGFEVVRRLRERGNRTPVIFLTAKNDVNDVVRGFDLGCDDYLAKPFRLAELLARIAAILRRSREVKDELSVAGLWMDVRNRRARRGDTLLSLSNTEFEVLRLLMTRQGELVSKQTIMREIWHDPEPASDNVVEVYINYLRGKLEAQNERRLIHTERGKGYVLEDRAP